MLMNFILEFWHILVDSAPYVLFGFFVAGLLKAYLPEDLVARHLSGSDAKSVLKASLFGIPLPLCSCGVIPAAIELRKQGASKGATSSFLVSVPETGVDSNFDHLGTARPADDGDPSACVADHGNRDRTAGQQAARRRGCCQGAAESRLWLTFSVRRELLVQTRTVPSAQTP